MYIPVHTRIKDGSSVVTTAGVRQSLSTKSIEIKKIDIVAKYDNTGVIVVGGSTVVASQSTRRGVPLNAGEVYTLTIDDLSKVFIDSTVSGEGVTYAYFI